MNSIDTHVSSHSIDKSCCCLTACSSVSRGLGFNSDNTCHVIWLIDNHNVLQRDIVHSLKTRIQFSTCLDRLCEAYRSVDELSLGATG